MAITYSAIEDAIRTRFNTEITIAKNVTTIFDNQESEPPTTGRWIRFTIIPNETEQVEFGIKKRFRQFGIATAQVFDEIGKGTKDINTLINDINTSGVFRSVRVSGITYRTPSILRVGRVGPWYQVNVNVPFYADDVEV